MRPLAYAMPTQEYYLVYNAPLRVQSREPSLFVKAHLSWRKLELSPKLYRLYPRMVEYRSLTRYLYLLKTLL